MTQKRLWSAAAIIAVIIIIGFAISVPHTRDVMKEEQREKARVAPAVTLHDSYKAGVHTITGSIDVPDACSTASANASLIGDASSTQTIVVDISYAADTGVCLQLPTQVTFSSSITAPPALPISATVNGVAASTTSS